MRKNRLIRLSKNHLFKTLHKQQIVLWAWNGRLLETALLHCRSHTNMFSPSATIRESQPLAVIATEANWIRKDAAKMPQSKQHTFNKDGSLIPKQLALSEDYGLRLHLASSDCHTSKSATRNV
jgi:hypothetical protein